MARPLAASRPRNFLVVGSNFALSAMAARPLPLSSALKAGDPIRICRSRLSARAAFSDFRSASTAACAFSSIARSNRAWAYRPPRFDALDSS
jgi:hypothetical protein